MGPYASAAYASGTVSIIGRIPCRGRKACGFNMRKRREQRKDLCFLCLLLFNPLPRRSLLTEFDPSERTVSDHFLGTAKVGPFGQ